MSPEEKGVDHYIDLIFDTTCVVHITGIEQIMLKQMDPDRIRVQRETITEMPGGVTMTVTHHDPELLEARLNNEPVLTDDPYFNDIQTNKLQPDTITINDLIELYCATGQLRFVYPADIVRVAQITSDYGYLCKQPRMWMNRPQPPREDMDKLDEINRILEPVAHAINTYDPKNGTWEALMSQFGTITCSRPPKLSGGSNAAPRGEASPYVTATEVRARYRASQGH